MPTNLPFALDADEVLVRRTDAFGAAVIAGTNGHVVRPGDLWHLNRDEAVGRADFEIVESEPDKPDSTA